jgi:hypothetical protein
MRLLQTRMHTCNCRSAQCQLTLPSMGASSITTVASAERTSWLASPPISLMRGSSCRQAGAGGWAGRRADRQVSGQRSNRSGGKHVGWLGLGKAGRTVLQERAHRYIEAHTGPQAGASTHLRRDVSHGDEAGKGRQLAGGSGAHLGLVVPAGRRATQAGKADMAGCSDRCTQREHGGGNAASVLPVIGSKAGRACGRRGPSFPTHLSSCRYSGNSSELAVSAPKASASAGSCRQAEARVQQCGVSTVS